MRKKMVLEERRVIDGQNQNDDEPLGRVVSFGTRISPKTPLISPKSPLILKTKGPLTVESIIRYFLKKPQI